MSLIPGLERAPGEGHGNPLQYSCHENPMDRRTSRLRSTGSKRVRHNWSDLAHMPACTHIRMHTPHLLHPFPCWWILKLLLCLDYCKQRCYEYRGACIFSDHVLQVGIHIFLTCSWNVVQAHLDIVFVGQCLSDIQRENRWRRLQVFLDFQKPSNWSPLSKQC